MIIKYMAIKEADEFRIVNTKLFREELARLPKGRYDITVTKHKRQKSNPQLAYYYGCVLPHFHKAAIDQGWEFADIDELDNYLKSTFASRDIINKHTAEVLSIPGLKRHMTSTEMAAFIDAIKDYASNFLGYRIPEPNEQLEIS